MNHNAEQNSSPASQEDSVFVPQDNPSSMGKEGTEQQTATHSVARFTAGIYSGPVPPPEIMEKLESLLPGAADRVLAMAEKDQQSLHKMRDQAHSFAIQKIKNTHFERILSLWMAFVISLSFAALGTFLIFTGHEFAGGTLIGATMIGIVTSFLGKQIKKSPEK